MSERFEPTDNERCRKLLAGAREANAKRDKIERDVGFAAPPDTPLDLHLRTAISAIVCGIITEDWVPVAEGLAMLQDAEVRARGQS